MKVLISKIKKRVNWTWHDYSAQWLPDTYWQNARGSRIFIYHGIDYHGSLAFNTRFISQTYFERQLAFFKEHFHVLPLTDLLEGKQKPDRFNIALTFDDGYLNNLQLALPLLEKYELPATFFVTTIQAINQDILWSDYLDLGFQFSRDNIEIAGRSFVKGKHEFYEATMGHSLKNICRQEDFSFKLAMMEQVSEDFRKNEELNLYWKLMNADELRQLNQSKWVSIGAHGLYHNNYDEVSESTVIEDLKRSKEYLENTLQEKIDSLAYPDGSYNDKVIDLAEQAGYRYQLAVDYQSQAHETDPRVWSRFGLNPYIKLHHQAKAIIKGRY